MTINQTGSPVRSIFDKFSREKEAGLVYGEPIAAGAKKVLPVAKASYHVGGGGGTSHGNEHHPASDGEGGGGSIRVKPLGIYEITEERTTYLPAYDVNRMVLIAALLTGGLAWCFSRKRK
ncbi:hypothetical protein [Halobacillus sp. Marseille-P3879]|uniref:hypothetical protein n=1 Tax=Halobacillus TaxID=45667 RepID=UPI000C7AE95D|nr:hypothetical protein [Halobacillus sp. Marseille-P3879]